MVKITESIELVDGTMANCYVLNAGGKRILIDAGMKSSGKKLVTYFKGLNVKPDVILITHYHPDHIGGLSLLVETFSPEVYASEKEIPVITGTLKAARPKGFMPLLVSALAKPGPVKKVIPLNELKIPGIEIIETPGHTPGSSSILFKPENALFVGDALAEKNGNLVLNRTFTLDIAEAERSRSKIMALAGTNILPGHGKAVKLP